VIGAADSYTNRKLGKSIILLAICTEGKLFTNISVGFSCRVHDARVLVNSELYKMISNEGSHSLFFNKYHLLGNIGYPNRNQLITTYKDYRNLTKKKKFNYFHSKTRVLNVRLVC